jgi:ParB family chromosome partitioning protein
VLTQEQVSQRIGKDRSTVTNTLRLLKLPEVIQTAVRKGDITSGHARALLALEDPALQIGLFQRIIDKGLSVRQIEGLVRNVGKKKAKHGSTLRIAAADSSVANLEDRLRQVLGTKVTIKPISGGKGEIIVEYYSSGDLERLTELFEGQQDRPYL